MNFEKAFGRTAKREREGAWFRACDVFVSSELSSTDDKARIKLASGGVGNPEFQKVIAKHALGRRRSNTRGVDMVELLAATHHAYAYAVVLDWEGFTDTNGKELPYSPEFMIQVFEQYPRAFDDVRTFAEDLRNFAIEAEAEAAKN